MEKRLNILTDSNTKLVRIDEVVVVSTNERAIVEAYAVKVLPTVIAQRSAKRRQTDPVKIKKDEVAGKLLEFAAHTYFKNKGVESTIPDTAVYVGKNKNFDSDLTLTATGTKVHCKSCHADGRYPKSWVFQYADAVGHGGNDKEIFQSKIDALVIMGVADITKGVVRLEWLARKSYLSGFMADPVLEHLIGIKKVVYHSTLESLKVAA